MADNNPLNALVKSLKKGGGGGGGGIPKAAFRAPIVPIALAVGGLWALSKSYYTVKPGHRAVVFDVLRGMLPYTVKEGLHFVIPFVQRPLIFDMRQQAKELIAESGSRDLQTIKLTVRMLYQPSANLHLLVKDVGPDYADKVLPSVGNEVLRSVIARYNASELLTQRNQVSLEIKDLLVNRSALFHTNIMDVSITELSFSPEYTRAVEAKQIAQQNAERAKFEVERAQQEKQSMLVLAEGEAKSALLVGKAVKTDPTYMMLESLKASKHIAELMSHSPNKAYLSSEDLLLHPAGLDPRKK